MNRFLPSVALAACLAPVAAAQSNVIPGTDVSLGILDSLTSFAHTGSLPTGNNALAMSTTSCNLGSVNVPWLAPMEDNHPLIAFLMTRVEPDLGRMIQISNYSHLKHGWFALSNSQCIPCQNPSPGTFLGIGCSDTYSQFNNSDNFYLGPAEEIDPWLGTWDPVCSYFDAGLNPTAPFDCDGNRSLSASQANSLGPLGNRMLVSDADLSVAGAGYFYAGYFVIQGEPEANRENNAAWRRVTGNFGSGSPFGGGPQWSFNDVTAQAFGTVLNGWPGATVTSGLNGTDDGRVYVATKVTGPDQDGVYHYEYAFHNRDNNRAVGAVRFPYCDGGTVQNPGFHDVDDDVSNNWNSSVNGAELSFSTSNNPLRWNSIYNVWFDSTAPPVEGSITLDAFFPGPGASSFEIPAVVPSSGYLAHVGDGCTEFATAGDLVPNGQPTLGNTGFAVGLTSGVPAATPVLLYGGGLSASTPLGACTLYLGGSIGQQILQLGLSSTDSSGNANFPVAIPNVGILEGTEFFLQAALVTGNLTAPIFATGELSDAIRLTLGNNVGSCN